MSIYVNCPLKKNQGKISIEVCIKKCKTKGDCKPFQEVSREDLHEAMHKLGIPVPKDDTGYTEELGPIDEEIAEDLARKPGDSSPKNPIPLPDPTEQNQQALEAFKRIMLIRTDIEVKFLEMGWRLDEIFSNQYHLVLGYKDQKDFCERALDLKERTAIYLRNIYLWQMQLRIPNKEIAEIGWSKVAQILPVAKTREKAMEWIKRAKEPGTTTQNLNTQVRLARGKITEEEAKKQPETLHVALYKEQKELVDLALNRAQKATGSESKGYLLADVICTSFMADFPDVEMPNRVDMVAKLIGRFEEAFKIKFQGEIIDLDSGEILIESKIK